MTIAKAVFVAFCVLSASLWSTIWFISSVERLEKRFCIAGSIFQENPTTIITSSQRKQTKTMFFRPSDTQMCHKSRHFHQNELITCSNFPKEQQMKCCPTRQVTSKQPNEARGRPGETNLKNIQSIAIFWSGPNPPLALPFLITCRYGWASNKRIVFSRNLKWEKIPSKWIWSIIYRTFCQPGFSVFLTFSCLI